MKVNNMLMRMLFVWSLLFCQVSYAGLFDDDKARARIDALDNQVTDIDSRIKMMEGVLESQALIEVYTRVEALELELGKLRGEVEVLRNENTTLQKRQKDFYIDLDSRLRRIEQPNAPVDTGSGSSSGRVEPTSSSSAETQKTSPARQSVTIMNLVPAGPAENKAYEVAYNAFRNGDYAGAIDQFETYLSRYPNSSLAPSAAYWVGNAHYASRDFEKAIQVQKQLIKTYPTSSKVPDALLNIASSQQETKGSKAAKATLKDLIKRYPFSDAANKAKRRLAN